jgi:hypothetical protein
VRRVEARRECECEERRWRRGAAGRLTQNPLSRLDTLGCAWVVVVEAKGHPHEVLMSGSLNQPPLASSPPSLRYRRQPPSSTKAPRRGKNFLGVGRIEGEPVSCSFRGRSRCSSFSVRNLPSPLPSIIIRESVHKNRGNKGPFRDQRKGDGRWEGINAGRRSASRGIN